jgi:molybdopterin/thiamine biosynthesis adenylyltransferase
MKQITVVGIGALGSHLVQFLRNLDVELRIIDFDRVEQRNVASQFHGVQSVGRSKVESLRRAMEFFWGYRCKVFPVRLGPDNASELLSGSTLVIDCLDNAASRKVVQDHVRGRAIPCLHGALAANGEFGRVVWDEDFEIDEEGQAGAATCEDGAHLPFIAAVSALLAMSASVFIETGRRISYAVAPDGTAIRTR